MFTLPLGDHARLRPLEPWQAPEFLAHIDRARPCVDPWIPWATFSTDLDSATASLQRYADRLAADTGRIYGIWLDGTLVGGVMFTRFDSGSGVCEVGCWTEPAGEGRGLVTRACRSLIDWAFRERGMSRVEWWVTAGNTRSIEVARRLGMTREGVLRQRSSYRGARHDSEVWSVLSGEWPPLGDVPEFASVSASEAGCPAASESEPVSGVRAELDRLMGVFVGAFTNTGDRRPDLGVIRDVFIPQGTIIANVGDEPVIYDLDAFIEPRQRMLTDGTLTEFCEWEVAARTEIFGSIAHRFSEYRKSGFHDGEWFEGSGHKTTQFLRTPSGWKMSSLAWDDAPAARTPAVRCQG
ncbi:GNAT family N-acetyltransferase [Streptomyces sp. NBC_01565]|uniref:GNAT family N-acetyltransferase n=1 Tax=Streptomyces sp. NBC_01565 TaxID=2975881 RepID=UPI002250F38D|nr:GNAT family protein [Streptomyces sp. NBC_01565]MCX4546190.1 GNAT family N-acetyltransferase [Streptomyces sp. NBC_01565]